MSEEAGEKVPLWIISFADMITLLMAFFVMLQTIAHEQTAVLQGGREASESFRRAIDGLGIPDLLWGKQQGAKFEQQRPKNYVPEDPNPDLTDHRRLLGDEEVRAAFADMEKAASTKSMRLQEVTISKRIVDVAFEPGTSTLTPSGREALEGFLRVIKDTRANQPTRLYVVALVPEPMTPAKGWALAASRASAAEAVLQSQAPQPLEQGLWQICSQGCLDLTRWRTVFGAGTDKAHILLAVTEAKHDGE